MLSTPPLPLFILIAAASGCTTLGPVPGMTMSNPIADDRPGAELQAGAVPGYFLSDAPRERADARKVHGQLAAWFNPGTLLGPAKGLGVGLRLVGADGGDYLLEPMLRYRQALDDQHRVSLSGVIFASHSSGAESGASYSMTRGGVELGIDIRVTPRNRWAELHLQGGASVAGMGVRGSYCASTETGWARDCQGDTANTDIDVLGAWPSAYFGASVDLFRDIPVLHDIRIGAVLAGGTRPSVRSGGPLADASWFSFGLELSVGLGQ